MADGGGHGARDLRRPESVAEERDRLRREVRELREELAEWRAQSSRQGALEGDEQRRFQVGRVLRASAEDLGLSRATGRAGCVRLLLWLLDRAGRVQTYDQLAINVFLDRNGEPGTHAVIKVYVCWLRQALGAIDGARVETVWARGLFISKTNATALCARLGIAEP